jgi:hypothetical protein
MSKTRPAARRPRPPRIHLEIGRSKCYRAGPHRSPLFIVSGGFFKARKGSHLAYITALVDPILITRVSGGDDGTQESKLGDYWLII